MICVGIAKATGGTLISSMANLDGDEAYDPAYLGISRGRGSGANI